MMVIARGGVLPRSALSATAVAGIVWTGWAIGTLFAGRGGAFRTLDAAAQPLGTDFTMIWTTGRLALAGQAAAAYDWPTLEAAEHAAHASAAIGFFGWHYPPIFLLVAAALAPLSYLAALAAWQVATLGAALAILWRILPRPETLLLGLGAPATAICLLHGQNAFLTAALLGGGLVLLRQWPVLAGILIGCLAYKPHFGLVVPVALVAGGHWRAAVAAAGTVLGLVAATLLLFGPEPWRAFLATADLTRTVVLEAGGTGWYKIGSAFSYVRMVGGSPAAAYAVQGAVTLAAVAAVAWLWRSDAPDRLKAASLVLAALLATPYLLDYDLVIAGIAIAFIAAHGLEHGFRRWEAAALALAWAAPFGARHLAYYANLPVALLSVAGLFILCVGRGVDEASAVNRSAASWR